MKRLYINTHFKILYKGNIFLSGIDNYSNAKDIVKYFQQTKTKEGWQIKPHAPKLASEDFIEFYQENIDHPDFKALKLIAGKNLKFKHANPKDSKYTPEQYERNGDVFPLNKIKTHTSTRTLISKQTGERITITKPHFTPTVDNYKGVFFFRSMSYNKGTSLIRLEGDKPNPNTGIHDLETAKYMENYKTKEPVFELSKEEYIKKAFKKFPKYREFFKHIKKRFSLSNNEARLLLKHTL